MKELKFDAVIIANGEYPSHKLPLRIIEETPFVVCCDGAADTYIATGKVPDIIIGDGDSLSEENKNKYSHLLHCITEQETNDQTKAVNFLKEKGLKRIAIVGATGKREDHTLGNISLLIEYARAGIEVQSFTNHGIFIPCNNNISIATKKGQQISIFRFTAKGFKSKGLLYPIYDFTNWWQGTLNECTEEILHIEAEGEYILFVNY